MASQQREHCGFLHCLLLVYLHHHCYHVCEHTLAYSHSPKKQSRKRENALIINFYLQKMTSVSALIFATIMAVQGQAAQGQTLINVHPGTNHTLVVPNNYSNIEWQWFTNNVWYEPCEHYSLFICNHNLTLINVSTIHKGYYYRYDNHSIDPTIYLVRVNPINKPIPKAFSRTTIQNFKTAILLNFKTKNITGNILPTTPTEKNTPNSIFEIIIALLAVGITIILCMIIYAHCYKKIHHKKEPLLSF
ncbi:unnamed protein product [simian adenovirus 29]